MHSSNKALIVGTGFGNLYKSIYESMGWQVTTVDIADPSADFNKPQDVIMEVFAESDKGKSLTIIENHRKLWLRVIGTRGHVGKKTINSSAQYNALFEF